MSISIKRLGPGDEPTLELLARDDADFELEGRGAPLPSLDPVVARQYLANPAVLHWVAVEDHAIVGFLYCILLPLRSGTGSELLLYEIGVRSAHRRTGIGRSLLAHMEQWMRENHLSEVWVCADNRIAVDFYRSCGFSAGAEQPTYLTRELQPPPLDQRSPT